MSWKLSFRPYLTFIEAEIGKSENPIYTTYLHSIAEILYANPVLLEPIEDWSILDAYKDLISIIQINHIYAATSNPLFAIGTPSPMRFFSYSEGFKQMIVNEQGDLKLRLHDDLLTEEFSRKLYRDVLFKCYGIETRTKTSFQTLMRLTDIVGPVKRYFHFVSNNQFVDIKHSGPLPPLDPEWVDYAKGIIPSYKNITHKLPMEEFSVEGFIFFTIKDETMEEALHELRENVATMHTLSRKEAYVRMKNNTLSLLEQENISVGFLPLIEVNKKFMHHKSFSDSSILYNLMQTRFDVPTLNRFFGEFVNACSSRQRIPFKIYGDIGTEMNHELSAVIAASGIKSLAIIPVMHQQTLVGLIELSSPEAHQIQLETIRKIEQAMPMYREFIVYQIDKLHEQMESFIMHNYTAIQPIVEWKFNQVAWEAMQDEQKDRFVPDVIFHQLSPFYGAVDVRNSSVERHKAIRKDFSTNLNLLEKLIIRDGDVESIVLDEIYSWQQILSHNLSDEDELILRRFIDTAIREIKSRHPESEVLFTNSEEQNYEESIGAINNGLKQVLEVQEQKIRSEIPVYFEKYKTDGWEYNLYAGQELNADIPFSPATLVQIKQWEIDTIVQMALASSRIHKTLSYPLETTQLMLAHSNPLDIRFRSDEHRFDVEGMYSIRYEVIKKRIDKVCIRDTHVRLTQPGCIAIVYLYASDIEEYLKPIQQYMKDGVLEDTIEYLNLEDLQGVFGLKAIRVRLK